MSEPIHLFVSSSPDLQAEREIIGQVVATLPQNVPHLAIGWRIGHTPMPETEVPLPAPAGDRIVRVEECDLYVLILGHDFAAPMGSELRQATSCGLEPLAFRKKCTNSPSAQDAIRRLNVEWRVFDTPGQLRQLFTQDLIQALIQRATELGLDLKDLESLMEVDKLIVSQAGKRTEEEAEPHRRDAGRSGVILGREVWE